MTIMNARSEPTPLSRPWIAGSVSLRVAAAFPYRRKSLEPGRDVRAGNSPSRLRRFARSTLGWA
jgi:hypothetical protein